MDSCFLQYIGGPPISGRNLNASIFDRPSISRYIDPMDQAFFQQFDQIREKNKGVDPAEIEAEIDEAVAFVREKKKKKN